jgi:competence protein ComEC
VAVLMKNGGRRLRFIITIGSIVFFSLLTGLSASVIRASLMGGLTVLAMFGGRKADILLVLFFSGFLMVLFNPRILFWDVSFQLSFLATLGLIVFMPFMQRFAEKDIFKKIPAFVVEGLTVTLAAQVFTTPVILYYFGRLSLVAPVTNVLFLPLIPWIMMFSFAALVSGFLFLPFTVVFTACGWLLVEILLKGVAWFAALPFYV